MIEMRHSETTERIIRYAIDIHKALGPGHPASYYTKALLYELEHSDMPVQANVPVKVEYKELSLGERKIPIAVADVVLVLPQTEEITDTHVSEAVNFLRATNHPIALILNFGKARLDIRRVAN